MIKRFFKILKLSKGYSRWMAFAALLGFFTVGSSVGLMMTSSYIIAKAALHVHISELQTAIVGVRFFGISRAVFRYFERYVSHEATFRLLAKLRVWFFKAYERIAPSKTKDLTSGDLLTRVVSDVETLEHIFVRVIHPPVIALAVLVSLFLYLWKFGAVFSFVFLASFLIAGLVIPSITFLLSKNLGEKIIFLRAILNELIVDGVTGMHELSAFNQTENYQNEFEQTQKKLAEAERKMSVIDGFNESAIGLTMNLTVITIYAFAVPMVNANLLDGVLLSVLSLGIMAAFEAVMPIPLSVQYIDKSARAAKRLFEITETKEEEKEIAQSSAPESFDLETEDLAFSYDKIKTALKEISFSVNQKEKIAIVGASGSGKTTLVNLLLAFWKYDEGKITLGSKDYSSLKDDEIRKYFSVISQQTFLFNDTIKNNLLLANNNATNEELNDALKQAELEEFVDSLPENIDAYVGEQGKRLSGGERKRISIARAILKESPVLICDEATSDLDSITEKKILETIFRICENKSLIFITHRFADLDKFNKILVLENGKIVERGDFQTLLNNKSKFYELFESQRQLVV
jgi:ATP-binding cassette subfamily C protein CydC